MSAKFDLRPKEASIEISVLGAAKGEKGSEHVAVALRGNPSSLRYVNDGGVFLYVKPGQHVLLVGAGDRLLERVVEVPHVRPGEGRRRTSRATQAARSSAARRPR